MGKNETMESVRRENAGAKKRDYPCAECGSSVFVWPDGETLCACDEVFAEIVAAIREARE